MGQPSMPEIREVTQLPHRRLTALCSQFVMPRVASEIGSSRGTDAHGCLIQPPAMIVLPGVAATIPHPIIAIIVSIIMTGLVSIMGKYLLFYARNRRARSVAEIRRAALEGRIAVSDAEKLIRADMQADPQQLEEGDATDEEPRPGSESECSAGSPLSPISTSEHSATGRIMLALRRAHFL